MPEWCSSRTSSPAARRETTSARSPARSACAPAESTTTSRTWASPRATTPFSRCWGTSPSATTSRRRRSPGRGSSSRVRWVFPSTSWPSRCSATTTRPSSSGAGSACVRSASSGWARRTTSGRWARPVRAAPAARSISTGCRARRASSRSTSTRTASSPWAPSPTAIPGWRSGTSSSCSSSARSRRARSLPFHGPRSTPAPASSGSQPRCKTSPPPTTPTSCSRSSRRRRGSAASGIPPPTPSTRTAIPLPCAVADHSRAASFLIADGVLPSNEGRGYVLRRILRRAIRHAQRLSSDPRLYAQVCSKVIDSMSDVYPELSDSRVRILETVQHETDAFLRTLDRGSAILAEEIQRARNRKRIPGEVAFKLYDTYGFPLDLTQVIAAESGCSVDEAGFETLMEEQRARGSFAGSGEAAVGDVYKQLASELGDSEFLGYEKVASEATLKTALVRGKRVQRVSAGEEAELFFDRTPFYGESGGQLGDHGFITGSRGRAQVIDTQKPVGGLLVHRVKMLEGAFEAGEELELIVDKARRTGLRANHSATHLLHRALRELLGEGTKQAGSVVAPDYLRFDYTSYQPLTEEQRMQIEARVNELIRENHAAETKVMDPESAVKSGAIAFFGDKYTQLSRVRVLQIGPSVELCGGTHVARSGDIGFFKIQSEGAIAAGVRRIVAVTGPEAVALVHEEERQLARAAGALRGSMKDVAVKAEQAASRIKELERELEQLQKRAAAAKSSELAQGAREVNGIKVLAARHESGDPEALRELADKLRDQLKSGIVVLGGAKDGKATLLVAVTADLAKRYKAGDLVKELSKTLGGRGGGKPELAQAGGGDPAQLDAALARAYELVGP